MVLIILVGTLPYIALFYCSRFMKRHLLLGGIAIAITFAATTTNVSPTLLVQQQPLVLQQAEAFTNTLEWNSKSTYISISYIFHFIHWTIWSKKIIRNLR
jgi:hypothetical protein